jgi:NADP-dependent 3-hydroxy acid dehydrogenase YdfG
VIEPGSTVVEGTAGNTGVGLALMGNARGYRTVIVMPQSQSQEKKDLLRVCGAEVVEVPAVPSASATECFFGVVVVQIRTLAGALDLKSRGIRVNVISPGPIKTPGLVDLAGPDAAQQRGMLDYMASTVPLGRVGNPDDIAGAAVFLASSDASFIAGTELFVDGGQAQI